MNKRISALAMASALAVSMAIPAFAVDTSSAAGLIGGASLNEVPVKISAEATIFDVTLPTQFPTTVDPSTGGSTTAEDATITNNSAGAIKVSNIEVNKAGAWHLADYDTDMSKEKVDSNKIGLQVAPKGGAKGAGVVGTALKTDASNADTQTLLTQNGDHADEWLIHGKNVTDGSNTLTVKYDAKVSPVSQSITNEQAATIVLTVAWDK